jgi:hypothetical protein
MTRNSKALGLALLAVFALGVVGTQGASAADSHQFQFDGQKTIITGKNTNSHEFSIGGAFAVQCTIVAFESTVDAGAGQTEADEITVRPTYNNCTFGGQAAPVFVNDCAYVFDSDTTEGGTTGGKHAQLKIECAAGGMIKIHTVQCTIMIGEQTLADAVTYKNDTANSTEFITTAHGIVIGKERNTASQPVNGCLTFPTGPVLKYIGAMTNECRTDEGQSQANPTTPSNTKDITTTECSVTDI